MNLTLNINTALHSIKGSADGNEKIQAAVHEAFLEIKEQLKVNSEREKKGLKPLPYKSVIKDEYDKDLVTVKEIRTLEEIRTEYQKKQESYSYDNRENNLICAMNEIGNSEKTEFDFKKELNKTLNSALFVNDLNLTPGLEMILDYFGNSNGLFNSINFKKEISAKCIKDLIDMPDPESGKPPKEFKRLLQNIFSINQTFKNNEDKDEYIEIARNHINLRYKKIIPEKYRPYFEGRGGLKTLLSDLVKQAQSQTQAGKLLNEALKETIVSEKNFKKMFLVYSQSEQFKNNPVSLANILFQKVPEANRETFNKWLQSIGIKDETSMLKTFAKWSNEAAELNKNIKDDNSRSK